jgi:uncharacterized phage infection (PIP) family protein YhgE
MKSTAASRVKSTIGEPIQLPTLVLQPGTYTLRLVDSPSDRHIVQVFDKSEQHLVTTILAIPNYRLKLTGKTQFMWWETPAGQPKALRAWFYPGDNFGQEFAYPKNMSTQIAAAAKEVVPTVSSTEDVKTAELSATTETGETKAIETNTQVAEVTPAPTPAPEPTPAPVQAEPTPAPVADTTPEPVQAPMPAELPKTASELPLVGLTGLAALSLAFALSTKSKRAQ